MSGPSIASQRPWQIVHSGREWRCCEGAGGRRERPKPSRVFPRCYRKVVGATGFEPATPCAQGKPRRALEVVILE